MRAYPHSTPTLRQYLSGAARWGLLAAGALTLEHFALWGRARRYGGFRRYPPYIVGTATLGAALTGHCVQQGQARAAAAFWLIAVAGGAAVVASYHLHEQWEGGPSVGYDAPPHT